VISFRAMLSRWQGWKTENKADCNANRLSTNDIDETSAKELYERDLGCLRPVL
jgi:hypothetical protein